MDRVDRKAALAGRVALLVAALGCAIAASLVGGPTAFGLTLAAAVVAGIACLTRVAVKLGHIIKPKPAPQPTDGLDHRH